MYQPQLIALTLRPVRTLYESFTARSGAGDLSGKLAAGPLGVRLKCSWLDYDCRGQPSCSSGVALLAMGLFVSCVRHIVQAWGLPASLRLIPAF